MSEVIELMAAPEYDVIIIGFGPTGAVAAALLSQAGHKVLVCERSDEIYPKPRAIAIDHEILRVFQQLKIADAIAPFTEPFTDSCFYGVDGQLIQRMTMVKPPYPQAWTPSMVFTQPPVEKVIRNAVESSPNACIWLGAELTSMTQSENSVHVVMHDGRVASGKYLIGCDGARSKVRELNKIAFNDLGFDQPWLVVDVLVNERGLEKLPKTSVQYCEPERPSTFVIGPKNHRRWEISLNANDDPDYAQTSKGTWELLKRWITIEDGELWRQASYRFHALIANKWRNDRVFIAGDAAHQQPPFLGQGMCQGIRDATNLSWKLNAVLLGQANDGLLDTYELERSTHVKALTTKLKAIGEVIAERDVDKARARDTRLLEQQGGEVKPTARQDVLPRLEIGYLATQNTAATGRLFPQPWIIQNGERIRMDDALNYGWRLFKKSTETNVMAIEVKSLSADRMSVVSTDQIIETEGVVAKWFEQYECNYALVRPDNYVFGTARTEVELKGLQLLL